MHYATTPRFQPFGFGGSCSSTGKAIRAARKLMAERDLGLGLGVLVLGC